MCTYYVSTCDERCKDEIRQAQANGRLIHNAEMCAAEIVATMHSNDKSERAPTGKVVLRREEHQRGRSSMETRGYLGTVFINIEAWIQSENNWTLTQNKGQETHGRINWSLKAYFENDIPGYPNIYNEKLMSCGIVKAPEKKWVY